MAKLEYMINRVLVAAAVIGCGLSNATRLPAQTGDGQRLDEFDPFVSSVMEEFDVPGLAIAVVRNGEVILSRGYGQRDLDEELPVTPNTLFAIGSTTKSFTVMLLGMLVDGGVLDWDMPVRAYLPDFELWDPTASQEMTARDLVTHRSGLPRHDLMWYGSELSRQELYERLRYLEPSESFRAAWQYQNLMYLTAGYLAERLTGSTWEELVGEWIFNPLGMRRSNLSVHDSQMTDDFAYPYDETDGVVRQIDFRALDAIGPAGSINSTASDMIRYVQLLLDGGRYGNEELLSEATASEMQTPQAVVPGTIRYDELGYTSYGMGLFVTTYRGHLLVHHGGNIDGFSALLSFMPRDSIGMIVLTNMSASPAPVVVTRGIYDRLLGLEPVDWTARVKEELARAEAAEAEGEGESYRVEGTALSHDLADYAGQYEHPAYGIITIGPAEGGLLATFYGEASVLEHFHYDVFEVAENPLDPFSGVQVQFLYNKKGEIDRLLVPLEPEVEDIVFTRVPDERMFDPTFLQPFAGTYELATGTVLTVELRGDATLVLTVPGQPPYELVPTRGTSFQLGGLPGYSVEFKEESGAVVALVIYQPNGTFVARRR